MTRSLQALLVTLIALFALAAPAGAAADGDDQVIITGGFELGPQQTAGDVVVVDGDVTLAGRVTGDVVAIAGDLRILGTVEGDATTVAGRAILGPRSQVDGDLVYSEEEPEIAPGASIGGEVRDEDWSKIGDAPWAIIGAAALWIAVGLSMLVLGVALVAIFPRAADAAYAAADAQIWLVVGLGLAGVIGLPLVIGLAAVSLVGIPLAIVVGLAVVPLWALGYVTCSYVLGRQIAGEGPHHILAFMAGLGVLRAVALVPVVGAIAWIPAVVVGLGALIVAAMPNGTAAPARSA